MLIVGLRGSGLILRDSTAFDDQCLIGFTGNTLGSDGPIKRLGEWREALWVEVEVAGKSLHRSGYLAVALVANDSHVILLD
jgi:hypothetical protein